MTKTNPVILFLFIFSLIGNSCQASYTQGFRGKSAFNPFSDIPDGQNYLTTPEWANDYAKDFIGEVLGFDIIPAYADRDNRQHTAFEQNLTTILEQEQELSKILEQEFLEGRNVRDAALLISYEWFQTHLISTSYPETELNNILKKSVFMVGQIGGDNYKNAFFVEGKTIEEAKNLVPSVVKSITDGVRDAIDQGAVCIVVPGNLPLGSLRDYLMKFESTKSTSYDEDQGLKSFNRFARYHNNYLQEALKQLRDEYPNIAILYADYYNTCLLNSRMDRLYY